MHHVLHVTRHTSHVTRHTSHITRHTSHVTRHTSHVTRHMSHTRSRWRCSVCLKLLLLVSCEYRVCGECCDGRVNILLNIFTGHSVHSTCSEFRTRANVIAATRNTESHQPNNHRTSTVTGVECLMLSAEACSHSQLKSAAHPCDCTASAAACDCWSFPTAQQAAKGGRI